jgi:hypothetical protein
LVGGKWTVFVASKNLVETTGYPLRCQMERTTRESRPLAIVYRPNCLK